MDKPEIQALHRRIDELEEFIKNHIRELPYEELGEGIKFIRDVRFDRKLIIPASGRGHANIGSLVNDNGVLWGRHSNGWQQMQ